MIFKYIIFYIMNCFRFADVIDNTATINTFNSENSNIAKIKIKHCQNMTTITNGIFKFEPVIKKPIVANYTFLTAITFSNISSFVCINSNVIQDLQNPFIKIKKLIFISLKKIVIKIIYHLLIYKLISTII